jgi:hypothetical protein
MSTEHVIQLQTSTSASAQYSTQGTAANSEVVVTGTAEQAPTPSSRITQAVYAYIRAVRAAGRTQVGTAEIARALDVPESAILSTLSALENRGVKKVTP